MKNYISTIIVTLVALSFHSCCTDCREEIEQENETPDEIIVDNPGEPPVTTSATLTINGVSSLDFSKLTAQSIGGTSKVNADGSFQVAQEANEVEILPLFFMKDGEIMFGYYPKSTTNNAINFDDILLFYFSLNPEISKYGYTHETLLSIIKASPKYTELKDLLAVTLNTNSSPLKNTAFVELLKESGNIMVTGKRTSKDTDEPFEFKFTYSRAGKIEWPNKLPIYSSLVIVIRNIDNQDTELSPFLVNSKGMIDSPSSLTAYIYDTFFEGYRNDANSVQLFDEGYYHLDFSVNQNYGISETIVKANAKNLANLNINLLVTAFPIGLKYLLKGECGNLIKDLTKSNYYSPVYETNFVSYIKSSHDNFYTGIQNCTPEAKWNYFNAIRLIGANLKIDEYSLELFQILKDYNSFNNSNNYLRLNYFDQMAFGDLVANFDKDPYLGYYLGVANSPYTVNDTIKETVNKWNISRAASLTTIEKQTNYIPVKGLVFDVRKEFGDATVNESKVITNSEGGLSFTFINGSSHVTSNINNPDSYFLIEPSFAKNKKELVIGDYPKGISMKLDSLEYYKNLIPGNWTNTIFYPDGSSEVYKVTFESPSPGQGTNQFGSGAINQYTDSSGNTQFFSDWPVGYRYTGSIETGYYLILLIGNEKGGRIYLENKINPQDGAMMVKD
ncbi:hypothetical protein H4O18_03705 [Arenibacter sp. BSSL-BM3]|uniref:Lipoprotein n=1 Tax=Arenibacter arenosicollis TaxID=2762274 RepID=A0ABR7QIU6_9FLAO|nr:hypothetical protein [Arenibacter arenosicollis]MBC8767090.1 hypothetical protein [Arenibacter arenosicollis]